MELNLISILLFALNVISGVVMWLLKTAYSDLKEQTKDNRAAVDLLNREAYKKEDFKEFKEELWRRFDEMNQRIQEIKHG